jgi:hypothetical protein
VFRTGAKRNPRLPGAPAGRSPKEGYSSQRRSQDQRSGPNADGMTRHRQAVLSFVKIDVWKFLEHVAIMTTLLLHLVTSHRLTM